MKLNLPDEKIAEFCRKWNVTEFALFGSVLRDDFRPDSDVDVLVTFAPGSRVSLFDFPGMQDELQEIFGRRVDLLTRRGVEESDNRFRKKSILESARVVYAES
ncbi:MAG TPA: nucleotidyltransferase family protein [Longimicrobium sp.]|nr:nucleotidyltransferase family protein [Longimicrobium sp.]